MNQLLVASSHDGMVMSQMVNYKIIPKETRTSVELKQDRVLRHRILASISSGHKSCTTAHQALLQVTARATLTLPAMAAITAGLALLGVMPCYSSVGFLLLHFIHGCAFQALVFLAWSALQDVFRALGRFR